MERGRNEDESRKEGERMGMEKEEGGNNSSSVASGEVSNA